MNTTMRTGAVKSHIPDEGYGFIAGSDGHDYYFAAKSVLDGAAGADMVGMTVTFKPKATSKGMRAEEITVSGLSNWMYVDPEVFIVTEQFHIKDMEILHVFNQPISCIMKTTDMGRQALMDHARSVGATGVVNFRCAEFRAGYNTYSGQAVFVQSVAVAADEQQAKAAEQRVLAALDFIKRNEDMYACDYDYNVFDTFLNLIPGFRKRKTSKLGEVA